MPDFASQSIRTPSPFNIPSSSVQNVVGGTPNVLENPLQQKIKAITKFYEDLENATQGIKYRDPHTSDIKRQIAHIQKMNGYAMPTRFYFELEGLRSETNERLVRNCQSTTLPGRALQTQPLKIYGPPKEFVYEANFQNELSMTFRVGEDMFEKDFFEGWMNLAISNSTYDLQYPVTYRSTLRIYQLDKSDYKVYCTELYNVFCKSIGDMELSTDSMDQISTINITLAYSDYLIKGKIMNIVGDSFDQTISNLINLQYPT